MTPDQTQQEELRKQIVDILEDVVTYHENRYSDPVYAKNGIDRFDAEEKLLQLITARDERIRREQAAKTSSWIVKHIRALRLALGKESASVSLTYAIDQAAQGRYKSLTKSSQQSEGSK